MLAQSLHQTPNQNAVRELANAGARQPGLDSALITAELMLETRGLKPAQDDAVSHRLKQASERVIAGGRSDQTIGDMARGMLIDYHMQEAAALRLIATGHKDPLERLSNTITAVGDTSVNSNILRRHGINPERMMDRLDTKQLEHMATGAWDKISDPMARLSLSAAIGQKEEALGTPVRQAQVLDEAPKFRVGTSRQTLKDLTRGPDRTAPMGFGRKGISAER